MTATKTVLNSAPTSTLAGSSAASAARNQSRRGVLPGSFLDLMMQAVDKTTGQGFTDYEIVNQVGSAAETSLVPCASMHIHFAAQISSSTVTGVVVRRTP